MSDLTKMVAGLRADTSQVNWPDAVEVRTRADRRTTRHWIAAAAAVSVAVAVTGGAFLAGDRRSSAPAGPGVTTQLPLDAIASAPSGTIYAITHTCGTGSCSESKPPQHYTLLRSTDLARSWTTVASLDGVKGGADVVLGLAAADDGVLWIANGTRFMGSADGGRHWNSWDLGADPTQSKGGGLVGTTFWLAYNGQVLRGTSGGRPQPTINQPPGRGKIDSVAAISADSAIALRAQGSGKGWYRTADGGAHWSAAADPCAGLSHPNVTDAYMAAGDHGGLWAVCFVAGGGAPGWQIATSADGGHSWQPHPGDAPGGDDVQPVSATIAWRTGNGADVYRTTDSGAHWTDVAHLPPGTSIQGGFVRDADTALYVLPEPGTDHVTLHLTTDGGTTWTTLPFAR
jgi:photosystem II stability/assembly factor-like uncharacterized protein